MRLEWESKWEREGDKVGQMGKARSWSHSIISCPLQM